MWFCISIMIKYEVIPKNRTNFGSVYISEESKTKVLNNRIEEPNVDPNWGGYGCCSISQTKLLGHFYEVLVFCFCNQMPYYLWHTNMVFPPSLFLFDVFILWFSLYCRLCPKGLMYQGWNSFTLDVSVPINLTDSEGHMHLPLISILLMDMGKFDSVDYLASTIK